VRSQGIKSPVDVLASLGIVSYLSTAPVSLFARNVMNQENKVPITEVETAYSVVISQDFTQAVLPIYWGPQQDTGLGIYTEPKNWHDNALLAIPMMFRFLYDTKVIHPEDYAPDVPPPPPPPTSRPISWRFIDTNPRVFPPGYYVNNVVLYYTDTNTPVYAGYPPATYLSYSCNGDITSCDCHPDCRGGYSPLLYANAIYAYPCGGATGYGSLHCEE
jgi:hypothetical protein